MTHFISRLFSLDMVSAWQVVLSLTFMLALLILVLVIVNWTAIRAFAYWLGNIWDDIIAEHDEWERSLTPEERAYLNETNLFI